MIDFLLGDWNTHPKHHQLISTKTIYFTTRKDVFKLNVIGVDTQCQPVIELSSNQEEADTKVFLAVKLAQEIGCTDAVIYTADSDVAILAMYYSRRLSINLFVQLGTGSNVRIVDVGNTDWQSELGEALHVISDCDLVSAFNGIGKAKSLSTLEKREECMNAMRLLGETLEVTEGLFAITERMVCHLYGMPEESDLNSARYKKFCRAKTPEPHQLPPTRDELLQSVKRANYQSRVSKQALNTNFELHSPIGHGWQDNEGRWEIF